MSADYTKISSRFQISTFTFNRAFTINEYITYDVGERRVRKVCKKLKEYLTWSQNSEFEGELSKTQLLKCLAELDNIIISVEDSIYLYAICNPRSIKEKVIGIEKSFEDLFL